jgi:hypothetical protein
MQFKFQREDLSFGRSFFFVKFLTRFFKKTEKRSKTDQNHASQMIFAFHL